MEPIVDTNHLFAIWHPEPGYAFHILILPKLAIRDFTHMDSRSAFWQELPGVVSRLVDTYALQETGYRLITNCGMYQQIPQLHFHLVSGEGISPGS